ncbi:MAG: hypothetical protein ACI840_001239 [Ulvibacter sp.]|jgi:hypothetical protein
MKNLIIVLISLLFFQNSIGQSAWNLEKDSWYTQLNYTRIGPYSELFIDGGKTETIPREIEDNTFQLYAEYGLNSKTTLSASLPIKLIKTGAQTTAATPIINANSVTSLGNIGFGVKRNLINKNFLLSTGVIVEANTGSYDDASGIRTGYDTWTFTPGAYFGKSYNNLFLQANVGVGFRTNNYSDFFRGGAEVGYKFLKRIWAIFYLDYKKSFYNGTVSIPVNNESTSLYVDNKEYVGYGLKAIYELTNQLGITAGFGGAFSANAEARAAALNVGLFMKIDPKK